MEQAERDAPGERTASPIDRFGDLPRRQVLLTLGGVMLALFLGALDQTIVATALPSIILDLGGFDRFTWVTTAYLVSSTTVVPIVGRLSDFYGRKWFYVVGIIIFLIGSALAGLSQSMNQLILFRAIQGIGGGVMIANAFVAIGDLFPPSERGKYQGLIAAVFGLSSIVGPTLGGFITDNLSWHWVFYVNIPIGIPVVLLFIRYFPDIRPDSTGRRIDYAGIALLIGAVVPTLIGLSWGGSQYSWGSAQVIGALATGAAMTALFIFVETRVPDPIMPLSIFRNRIVAISLLAIFLTGFGMFGAIVFIPLFFQGVLGSSATSSGTFLTPMMLGMVFGAAISGQLLSRVGGHYRIQGLVGLGIMIIGAGMLTQLSATTSQGVAVAEIVVLGFGLGTTFPLYTIAIQNNVPHSLLGIATSSTQFFRSIGGTLGLALLGSLMTRQFSSGFSASIPQSAIDAVGVERIAAISDHPQALMNPEALASLQQSFAQAGPEGAELADHVFGLLRQALAAAIGDIFMVALGALILAFIATIFLKEIPLRRRGPESGFRRDRPAEVSAD